MGYSTGMGILPEPLEEDTDFRDIARCLGKHFLELSSTIDDIVIDVGILKRIIAQPGAKLNTTL